MHRRAAHLLPRPPRNGDHEHPRAARPAWPGVTVVTTGANRGMLRLRRHLLRSAVRTSRRRSSATRWRRAQGRGRASASSADCGCLFNITGRAVPNRDESWPGQPSCPASTSRASSGAAPPETSVNARERILARLRARRKPRAGPARRGGILCGRAEARRRQRTARSASRASANELRGWPRRSAARPTRANWPQTLRRLCARSRSARCSTAATRTAPPRSRAWHRGSQAL